MPNKKKAKMGQEVETGKEKLEIKRRCLDRGSREVVEDFGLTSEVENVGGSRSFSACVPAMPLSVHDVTFNRRVHSWSPRLFLGPENAKLFLSLRAVRLPAWARGFRGRHQAHCAECNKRTATKAFSTRSVSKAQVISWYPRWHNGMSTQKRMWYTNKCSQTIKYPAGQNSF